VAFFLIYIEKKARLVLSELILQKPIKFNFSENCGTQHFS
jgi:hypothetical protein